MSVEDLDDDHEMPWEEEAREVVERSIENADVDDIRGTITIKSLYDHRYDQEFESFDDLREHLEELYDEQWYGNVPAEGGEAVFDSDSSGVVGDMLSDT